MRRLKKSHIFVIVTFSAAAVLLTLVLIAGMNAPPYEPAGPGNRSHENAKVLSPEEFPIDSLDISWLSGPVTVGVSTDGQIHVTERSSEKLDEGSRMKLEADSGTLKIRWDGQWFRRFFNVGFGWFGVKDKELEVLLPGDTARALASAEVSNTSGALEVSGCRAEKLSVSTVSGELTLSACSAEELVADSVSGSITLADISASEAMTVNTVSGGMELTGVSAGKLSLDTVSGACSLLGDARDPGANTISGDVTARLSSQPETVDMDSVSGALRLELPAGSGFTVAHDSVSGGFKCAFPTEDLGGHRLRCGSGGADIQMNTTSGSMDIRQREA